MNLQKQPLDEKMSEEDFRRIIADWQLPRDESRALATPQTLLFNEEALLLAMYLRNKRKEWIPKSE